MPEITQGTRVFSNAEGWLKGEELYKPASYGRATNPLVIGRSAGWWTVTAPNGDACSLDPAVHQVVEHDDGTITVSPSIDMSRIKPSGWHGFLVNGVFTRV